MTEKKPVFDLVDIVTKDFEATVAFYQALGLDVDASAGVRTRSGMQTCTSRTARRSTSTMLPWRRSTTRRGERARAARWWWASPSRAATLSTISTTKLTGDGYEGRQVPYDAFWGARYAIVADPNGVDVGIMSPVDESKRAHPPSPSPDE